MTCVSQRKYHYIYKITRHDGAYYIGMRSTDNLADSYFGSGRRLWHSIKKYGKENHTKEIIEFLPTRELLNKREIELVTKELLEDKNCLNIRLGGSYEYKSPDSVETIAKRSESLKKHYASTAGDKTRQRLSEAHSGRKHTLEAKANMSKAAHERMTRIKENGLWENVVEKNRQSHIGKKQSEETINKRNASLKSYKLENGKRQFSKEACFNISQSQLGNQKHAKDWILIDAKTKDKITVKNLRKWLRENDLVLTRSGDGIKKYLTKEVLYLLLKAENETAN